MPEKDNPNRFLVSGRYVMKFVTNAPGTPVGGYKVVGDILATNSRQFKPGEGAMDVAIDIVSSGAGGWPVVGEDYEFLGFINEGDLIRAMEAGVDLKKATASDIMNTAFIGVREDTSLSCVSRMFEMGFQILPVIQDGKVT